MEILLKRVVREDRYTEGRLSFDGTYVCDTIEDRDRDVNRNGRLDGDEVKIQGETAIPNGRYRVTLEYSPKFSPRYGGRRIPTIHDVPGFSGIRIHSGNTAHDSDGCVIVGIRHTAGMVRDSRATLFDDVIPPMEAAEKRKEAMWITVC